MKKALYTLLILSFLGFIGFLIAFNHYVLDRYEEMDSPYELNEEYNTVLVSRAIRRAAMYIGISDDSWILSPIVEWHRKAYERALEIIPEDDGERIIWEVDFKIRDYGEINSFIKIYTYFKKLKEKEIKNDTMSNLYRVGHLNAISWYLLDNKIIQNDYSDNYEIKLDLIERNLESINRHWQQTSLEVILTTLKMYTASLIMFLDRNFDSTVPCPKKKEISQRIIDNGREIMKSSKYYSDNYVIKQRQIIQDKINTYKKTLRNNIEKCKAEMSNGQ